MGEVPEGRRGSLVGEALYILHRDVLEHLLTVFVSLEAEFCHYDVTFVEPQVGCIAEHHCHILVLELASKLLQHDIAL